MKTNALQTLVFAPKKLRDARLRRFPMPEWSLRKVASAFHDVLGVTPQALSQYETGKSKPTADRLVRLCRLYEVELSELTDSDSADFF